MDIIFKCPHCDQELEVDAGGAGSTLECPSCSNVITVPTTQSGNAVTATAQPITAPASQPVPAPPPPVEEKHFSVPTAGSAGDLLIKNKKRPLDIVAKDGDKRMRIKTFKRSDCQEVGRDRFDEKVSEFLEMVGQINIVSINPISYSMEDLGSHAMVVDYGVLIVYKG